MTGTRYLALEGEDVPLKIRRNAQAKRMTLRVDRTNGDIKVTVPKRISEKAIYQFLEAHLGWLIEERGKLSVEVVGPGMVLPYMGEGRQLVFTGASPRKAECSGQYIYVGGPEDMAAARLEKWLREQARLRLGAACSRYADVLGVSYGRISIGDMKSRWGSCSSSGTLRFNWRLVMAPAEVLDYVAAHEVSHLLEMNHSEYFWRHVARCMPEFDRQRRWLRKEGSRLFSYHFA